MKWKIFLFLLMIFLASGLTSAFPTEEKNENSISSIHIIKPPIRCPDGMRPDANGRCRVVWERSVDAQGLCFDGKQPDYDGICRGEGSLDCFDGECERVKRNIEQKHGEEQTETIKSIKKTKRVEALRSGKKIKKRSYLDDEKAGKQARSKHAFLIMLKKKKMQMMKPKPPPPPHHPPHHHPPHHEGPEEEPEEEPAEEEEPPAPERLFFGDEVCLEAENSTKGCRSDAEMVENVEANKEFKEWRPEKSSESSDSSSFSSDSTGESESQGVSEESENELLEKAIKIKLMKLFRMKQRYGPTLRRWIVNQLREYEDSLNDK